MPVTIATAKAISLPIGVVNLFTLVLVESDEIGEQSISAWNSGW